MVKSRRNASSSARAERVVAVDEVVVLAVTLVAGRGASAPAAGLAAACAVGLRRLVRRSTCRRNVATSITFVPNRTCARRNRRPMIQQFRKSFLTW